MRCKNEVEFNKMIYECGTDIGFIKEEILLCDECKIRKPDVSRSEVGK